MNIRTIIHDAEEGGYWAEVPAIPGCVSQGETMDELLANLREACAIKIRLARQCGKGETRRIFQRSRRRQSGTLRHIAQNRHIDARQR